MDTDAPRGNGRDIANANYDVGSITSRTSNQPDMINLEETPLTLDAIINSTPEQLINIIRQQQATLFVVLAKITELESSITEAQNQLSNHPIFKRLIKGMG